MGIFNRRPKPTGLRQKKASKVPVILAGILAAGSLAGSGVGIWHISQNYKQSPEFTQSVTGRMEIDPAAFLETKAQKESLTREEALDITHECAKKLSRWLKDKGQENYDVSYEVTQDKEQLKPRDHDSPKQFYGFLSAKFELEKIKIQNPESEEEEEKKVDNDPYLSYFSSDAFNSNEKSLVYRWYCPTDMGDKDYIPRYSVIPLRKVFDIPNTTDSKNNQTKAIVNKDGDNGVMYRVESQSEQYNQTINDIYKNLNQAQTDSKDAEEGDPIKEPYNQPRLYIVNNLPNLYSEANYHISFNISKRDDEHYHWWYESSQYSQFVDTYKNNDWKSIDDQHRAKSLYRLQECDKYNGEVAPTTTIENIDIFNYVDTSKPGQVDSNISFVNKYIDSIVTMENFEEYMPDKITDDYKNDVEDKEKPKISYFWFKKGTKSQAKRYLNNQIKYGFKNAEIQSFVMDDVSGDDQEANAGKVYDTFTGSFCRNKYLEPTFVTTLFGGNQVVGILSLGFLLFLIALLVILAALYRTTGVISWICMIFALSMTGLIVTIGATAISMSMLFGFFTISIAAFMACLAICGRMKRRLHSNEDTQVMIKKTFKSSLLPIVDISIISLIFGVCFIYIAPISLNALGLVLVTGAFAIFISIYLLNALLHGIFFNNQLMFGRYQFFGKPTNIANEALTQGNNAVPTTMDATKLQIPYYSSMSQKRIDVTGKKALIAIVAVAIILAGAVVAFTIIGYTSPKMFHTTSCIVIFDDETPFKWSWVAGLDYVSYRHDAANHSWYFYTNLTGASLDAAVAQIQSASGLKIGETLLGQHIFGSTNQDTLNFALIAIMVGGTCSAIYGAFRYNWISLIPMLASAWGIPLITLGISALSQIKFDEFIIMAYVLIVVVNALLTTHIAETINESWNRKDAYANNEFKFIVNTVLTNDWTYIWATGLAYLLFVLSFVLTAPTELLFATYLMLIGCAVTMVCAPFVVSFLVCQFMKLRNIRLYNISLKHKNKVVVNLDSIDEQEIEGINKFTKTIPVVEKQNKQ